MRVLHVHSGNLFGGVETMLLTQARHQHTFPNLQFEFALCFEGRLRDELMAFGSPVYELGGVRLRDPISVRRARRKLDQLLRSQAFEVVVTHSSWSQAIFGSTIRRRGVPLVSYLHAPLNDRHWLERLAKRTKPDLILCNSKFTAGRVPLIYPEIEAQVLYCPVSPPTNHRFTGSRERLRAELQTPDDATVIIQVGRIERGKGQLLHLEALARLKDVPNWVCWQVGGAQRSSEVRYLTELKNRARELGVSGQIRFVNERSDVSDLLAAADIYCQPNSRADSFGITFVEALYVSLPVITSALGGAQEIVDERCGIVVPANDIQALEVTLRRLIEHPTERSKFGLAGPLRAKALCNPTTHLNRLHTILSSAIGDNRSTQFDLFQDSTSHKRPVCNHTPLAAKQD